MKLTQRGIQVILFAFIGVLLLAVLLGEFFIFTKVDRSYRVVSYPREAIVTPTIEPTATPSATPVFRRAVLPTSPAK